MTQKDHICVYCFANRTVLINPASKDIQGMGHGIKMKKCNLILISSKCFSEQKLCILKRLALLSELKISGYPF